MCTVSTTDKIKLLTVRGANFDKVPKGEDNAYECAAVDGLDDIMSASQGQWIENVVSKSEMADLTTAKYVISGGRALKSSENFGLLMDIAETLGP